jgi:uncharacterized protein YhdP
MSEKSFNSSHTHFSGLLFLRRRGVFLFFLVLFFLSVSIAVGMKIISVKFNKNQERIVAQIKQELDFPLTFDSIKTGWFGLSLGVSLQNVTIFDSEVPIPFVKIETIKIFPEIKTLLFEQAPQFKKIVLKGLKVAIGWHFKEGFSVLGLQGESIPTNVNYASLMALISKQQNIVVKNAEIDWWTPEGKIKHLWQGKFNRTLDPETSWFLRGTQRLQLREGLELPESDFMLTVFPALKEGTLKIASEELVGECHLATILDTQSVPQRGEDHKTAGKPFWTHGMRLAEASARDGTSHRRHESSMARITCQGHVREIGMADLRQHYIPKATDPAFLQWFLNALPSGTVSDSKFRIYGALDALEWQGSLKLKGADFYYAKGWPELTDVTGFIEIENKKIVANLVSGKIMDWPIESTSLTVQSAEKNQLPIIDVKGSIQSNLEAGLLFLQRSAPLKTLADALQPLHLTGPMHLDLKLKIPLEKKPPIKVDGLISTKEADLKRSNVNLTHIQGNFHFTEQTFTGSDVRASLDKKPLVFDIKANVAPQKSLKGSTVGNIDLLIKEFNAYGLSFNKTTITTQFLDAPLNWSIEGPSIKGKIIFPSVNNNTVNADLNYLKIAQFDAMSDGVDNLLQTMKKSALYCHCKHFQYMEKLFGEISFKLLPKSYGYEIQNLDLKTHISELEGSGEWHLEEGKSYTLLHGAVFSTDMEKTFLNWGASSAIRDASGYIKYQLKWPKSPFQFRIGLIEGMVELKLDKGRILGVDPGLGRIMGLLNIESIRRRLQFDFSDLFEKGFVFDSLKGQLSFKQGQAKTENFFIDGPSAKIELAGSMNLENKTIDFKMTVVPHAVGVGLPLAAVITGNPALGAIGAGVWVIDKFTGKINKLTQHRYHVTGTWEEPIIRELSTHQR